MSESSTQTIVIGADHGGFELKELLKKYLQQACKVNVIDVGTHNTDRVDYPDYARLLCAEILAGRASLGIIVCGSGIGVSIACNKVEGIRCAQCHDHYTASMARKHNDANVMSLGGRVTGVEVAYDMVSTFISEQFGQAQHTARVQKLCSSYMSQL